MSQISPEQEKVMVSVMRLMTSRQEAVGDEETFRVPEAELVDEVQKDTGATEAFVRATLELLIMGEYIRRDGADIVPVDSD